MNASTIGVGDFDDFYFFFHILLSNFQSFSFRLVSLMSNLLALYLSLHKSNDASLCVQIPQNYVLTTIIMIGYTTEKYG